MKLTSFRIRNYRSIVDSGFNNLAQDNVTAIIGQNESGKTSILEALRSFSDGQVIDDILRSDLSLPAVSCAFMLGTDELAAVSQDLKVPDEIKKSITDRREVLLTRKWEQDKSSRLFLEGDEIVEIYRRHENIKEQEDQLLFQQVNTLIKENDQLESDLKELHAQHSAIQKQLESLEFKVKELTRTLEKPGANDRKEHARLELDRVRLNIDHDKARILLTEQMMEERNMKVGEQKNRVFFARLVQQAAAKLDLQTRELKNAEEALSIAAAQLLHAASNWEKKKRKRKIKQLRAASELRLIEYKRAKDELLFNKNLTSRVFSGMEVEAARAETMNQLSGFAEYPSQESVAAIFFPFLPEFELFEDFSSLLPNRIDLDDLLDENTTSEGFKAARNFLLIAGLDAGFFKQPDNRILKQKIENLNGEITIDFQDYWRQSVGKNNKIRINFELEHYDLTHPEKKGRPYIEFWIKDERERLYPKQRSRGVRWFLSFYLELKASAKSSKREKILLIDEPGLSLHARAQEDVLKVFEDIKNQLMIIYTTHSPHLIDIHKLYRILAVQRAVEDDETSQSLILDAKSLMKASADTLSPIYTLMGARITDQQHIHKNNNIIVEDPTSFYLLKAFFSLLHIRKEAWFLPAASVSSVELLANLLLGWKLDFIIVLNDNLEGRKTYNTLVQNIFGNNKELSAGKLVSVGNSHTIIDLLSTIDFKNQLLKKRVGITESNSEYLEINEISGSLLAMDFNNRVIENKLTWDDLDQESRTAISAFVNRIEQLLQ